MPLPNQKKEYTTAFIYSLPAGERAELIDGQIYYMAAPNTKHQRLLMALSRIIANYIDLNKGICEVFPAPFAVFLNEDDKTYVEPDISIICNPDKLNDRGCAGAPDWVIEIVSPGSRRMDYSIKLFKYRSAGIREYWIVDPGKNRIMVHDLEHEDLNEYTFSDSIKAGIYEDLSIDFGQLNI